MLLTQPGEYFPDSLIRDCDLMQLFNTPCQNESYGMIRDIKLYLTDRDTLWQLDGLTFDF